MTSEQENARALAIKNGLTPDTLIPYVDGWIRPTGDDMRIILKLAGFTGSAAGNHVGVESRQIRNWVAGKPSASYAGWCLLVKAAGLGDIPPSSK